VTAGVEGLRVRRVNSRRMESVIAAFAADHKLSGAETTLLAGATRGLNNDEVAELLGCSRATVSTYWNRIFAKLGRRSQRDVFCKVLEYALEQPTDARAPVESAPRESGPPEVAAESPASSRAG
jgi:DNA-binding CsgD family transcriptional regulator